MLKIVEKRAKRCLDKIEPLDSLSFDVSVARHMMEGGRIADAATWLGPTCALLELRKCAESNLLDRDELRYVGNSITFILRNLDNEEGLKKIIELQDFLTLRAYIAFFRCMRTFGVVT